ncbi:SH3 domain-containing protein [Parablautia intestinalis]|jgi:uncharacterized protein YgiM (DUF1202 family)|uniref:SH3 domain-containing protein n=1 Tax=Parablautia intestinalis TaxID=2320100 RepID=A0A3A9AEU2_9FIRM|nr:SH3 domain-containing protein [Parablautia intestinalis]MCI8615090.1 SH3 domain-containing protein [Lachnospiraceae bacterium]RKI90180.1 SH3 domain-containing protein [Parablautia intestinalis]
MSHSDQNKTHGKDKFISALNWIMDHSKIVMPLVLVFCVLLTIIVAVNANHKKALEKEEQQAAMALASGEGEASGEEGDKVPAPALEKNAYPELNQLICSYYDAQASGDMETITSLNTYLNEIETIRVQELSKYIDSYSVMDVYTKPGMEENTYVAYVCSEVKFTDADQALPGMQTYYIGLNDAGEYFINDGTYDDVIWNYIKEATLQDDVVDLNNKITVEYNERLTQDEELNEFIAYLKEKINKDVGEILAAAEVPEETEAETAAESEEETPAESGQTQNVIRTVRATDVVNIRKSDSEEADKIDKAQVGQEFTLVEERGNGWSEVEYNGSSAYIKSDYLEVVSEETVDAVVADNGQQSEDTQPEPSTASSGSGNGGKVKVKESVKIRKSASTDAEALGTAYEGDELELVMKQADGWTKVKYNGQTAFVKSDYVE